MTATTNSAPSSHSRTIRRIGWTARPWLFPTALLVLGLGFALVPLAQGKVFFYWDNAQQHYAQTAFLQEGLSQGTIPQWWPNVGLGFPATAEGQAAHYHPIRLLSAVLFSTPAALMWELALYFAIAGISTYFFLREFRLHRTACFLGAASQMFCGFALVYVRNIALHRSFCLVPLAMLCAERFVRRGSARSWLAGAVVIGVQFLAGHPSLAIVSVVATSTHVALRAVQAAWKRASPPPAAVKLLSMKVGAWGAAAALGFGLAAVQVLPTLLHVQQSHRQGGLSFDSGVGALPATVRGLGQLLLPYVFPQGDLLPVPAFWGWFNPAPSAGMYSGMLCVVLVPIGLWWRRRWPDAAIPLAASFVAAIGFALGPKAPLFPALWSLPGMHGLRYPSRFLLWAAFCLSCLAAFGAHRLVAIGRVKMRTAWKLLPLGLVAVAMLTLAGAAWVRLPEARSGVSISMGWFGLAVLLATLLTVSKHGWRRAVLLAMACVAIGDLWYFRSYGGYAPAIPIDEALKPPAQAEFLMRDSSQFRTLSLIATDHGAFTTAELRDFVQADVSTVWGIDSADVYLSLFLKRYFAVRSSIVQELLARPESARSLASFLAALNVKYLIAPAGLDLLGWQRVYGTTQTEIWRNPIILPRAYLVGHVVAQGFELREDWRRRSDERLAEYRRDVADWSSRAVDAQILDHVMDRGIDYAATAEVSDIDGITLGDIDAAAFVRTLPGGPDEMRFAVSTSRPAFLVISNSSYPGWTATVSGRSARLVQTNWLTTGLMVPAGNSEVILRYRTPGFRTGRLISAVVLLIVTLLLFVPTPVRRVLSMLNSASRS